MALSSIANIFSLFTPSEPSPLPQITTPSHLSAAVASTSSPINYSVWPRLVVSNEAHLSPSRSSDVMRAVCPSLAYANTMFFRSAYIQPPGNRGRQRARGEVDRPVLREVFRAGVIQECKRRRYFENNQEKKKRKAREAAKRNRRRRPPVRPGPQDKQDASKANKEDKDDNNWDLPEVDLPYQSPFVSCTNISSECCRVFFLFTLKVCLL